MQPLTDEQINDALKDKFMTEECNKFTRFSLENGIKIDTICALVKEYQTKYLYIKSFDEKLAREFDMKKWWKLRNKQN